MGCWRLEIRPINTTSKLGEEHRPKGLINGHLERGNPSAALGRSIPRRQPATSKKKDRIESKANALGNAKDMLTDSQ